MPELPDIDAYVHAIQARTSGETLESVVIASPFLLRTVEPRPEDAVGQKLRAVHRLGKRVVLEFPDELFFVIHLMIAGRFRWWSPEETPKKLNPRAGGLAEFGFATGTLRLTESSKKKRAKLHVVRGRAALAEHDPGGVEPLEVDRDAFIAAMTRTNHTLKRALTDPRILSGIGNAYSDEILHAAMLPPTRWTSRLDDEQWTRLHDATRQVLSRFRQRMIDELGDDFPAKVTAFRPDMAVHGRYLQPCPRCGEAVQRIRYATNETNYCARCQNDGRLLADRGLSRLLKGDWPKTLEELEELRSGR